MFKQLGAPEIMIILVVLVLLFGAKRLPDAARSLGRSMRIFKTEVKEMREDGKDDAPPAREVEGRVVERPVADPTQQVPDAEREH
jgi:sec-independent protein translocase protein TatA